MNTVLLVTTAQAFVQQMLIDLLVLGEGKTRDNSSDWASAHMSSHYGGDKALVSIARCCLSCKERNAGLHVREHNTAQHRGQGCVCQPENRLCCLTSHFKRDKVSLLFALVCSKLVGTQASGDSPISASHLCQSTRVTNMHRHT